MLSPSPSDSMLPKILGALAAAKESDPLRSRDPQPGLEPGPRRRETDLAEAVRQGLRSLEHEFHAGIQLQLDIAPNTKPVGVEAPWVNLVTICLCRNALAVMPEGGVLLLELFTITLSDEHPKVFLGDGRSGEYSVLAVSDSGQGMDRTVLNRLFEAPQQSEEAMSCHGPDLRHLRDLVGWCGGHVWVYSEPGHGTQFEVFFPVA